MFFLIYGNFDATGWHFVYRIYMLRPFFPHCDPPPFTAQLLAAACLIILTVRVSRDASFLFRLFTRSDASRPSTALVSRQPHAYKMCSPLPNFLLWFSSFLLESLCSLWVSSFQSRNQDIRYCLNSVRQD